MLDILGFHIIDIVDIFLVALLVFYIFKLIKGTSAMSIFIGILILYVVWIVVKALDMKLLSSIMGQVLGVGVIALIILFQQEIRRALVHIGNNYLQRKGLRRFSKLFGSASANAISAESLDEITQACRAMSETRTGALIVMPHISSLDYIIKTGDTVDARINRRLIENIFFKNSPLHDGAMIIVPDRIVAARCTLPIVENPDIPAQYGLRHRAACAVTMDSDATAVVVSEETGGISFVCGGKLKTIASLTELRLAIEKSYKLD